MAVGATWVCACPAPAPLAAKSGPNRPRLPWRGILTFFRVGLAASSPAEGLGGEGDEPGLQLPLALSARGERQQLAGEDGLGEGSRAAGGPGGRGGRARAFLGQGGQEALDLLLLGGQALSYRSGH